MGLDGASSGDLRQFIETYYMPWAMANRPRSASASLARIKRCFQIWYSWDLASISAAQIESWKSQRLRAGIRPATVLRDLAALSAVLSHAVRIERLPDNPMRRVEKPRLDRTPSVRFLDPAEEAHLRSALENRDVKLRAARDSANGWRRQRHRATFPRLLHFGDHMTAAVILSLNTGLRRGELLALRWRDVNYRQSVLSIQASSAKTGQTRHVPLNLEAIAILKRWQEQNSEASDMDRIFAVTTSFKTAWAGILKAAEIKRFRWHDLRHHFASRLVQANVNLNTVRELLGHGSLAMTLRYAHLGPDQKRNAVALLISKPAESVDSKEQSIPPTARSGAKSQIRPRVGQSRTSSRMKSVPLLGAGAV